MFGFTRASTKWIVSAGCTAKMASLLRTDCQSKVTDINEQQKLPKVEVKDKAGMSTSSNPHAAWDKNWDMRKHKQNKNKVVHQIIMVRHGQYNTESDDDAERYLTAIGRQQAEATGKRLHTLLTCGQLAPVKTVYFSTMTRATETCQLILPQITQSSTVPTLASTATSTGVGSTGIPLTVADSAQKNQKEMRVEACSMIREGAVCRPSPSSSGWDPSEECFEKEGARVLAAFKNHVHRASESEESNYSTILVCHGNVIRYFVMKALQLPPEAWLRTNVYNGSITILEVRANGNVSLRTMGDNGHMPPELITYN